MIAFRVSINGECVATAGIPGSHVLSAIVNSVEGRKANGQVVGDLWLHLGGLESRDGGRKDRHVDWFKGRRQLRRGDVVSIEIVDVDHVDEPVVKAAAKERPRIPQPPRQSGPAKLRVVR